MEQTPANQLPSNKSRWKLSPAFIGFLVGSAIPFAYGVYVGVREQLYFASHPLKPNEARCGMGMLLAFCLVFVVAPTCGAIGALAGWLERKSSN